MITKKELRKAIDSITDMFNKRIGELESSLIQEKEAEEDGMLSKRHLGPNACASCNKKLDNLQGIQVDFSPYKKMPVRDHSERIAKYGAGFSRMLSTLPPSQGGMRNSPSKGGLTNVNSVRTLHQPMSPQIQPVYLKSSKKYDSYSSRRNDQYKIAEKQRQIE